MMPTIKRKKKENRLASQKEKKPSQTWTSYNHICYDMIENVPKSLSKHHERYRQLPMTDMEDFDILFQTRVMLLVTRLYFRNCYIPTCCCFSTWIRYTLLTSFGNPRT